MEPGEKRNIQFGRRKALGAIGATVTLSAAGCLDLLSDDDRVDEVIETLQQEYGDYDGNPGMAIEDGFLPEGPLVQYMGWHFVNPERIGDAVENGFQVDYPQILLYGEDGETLVGVEWAGPAEQLSRSPDFLEDVPEAEFELHGAATHVLATGDGQANPVGEIPLDELLDPDNWTEFIGMDPDLQPGDTIDLDFTDDGETEERVVDYANPHPDLVTLHCWAFSEPSDGLFSHTNENVAPGGEEVEF